MWLQKFLLSTERVEIHKRWQFQSLWKKRSKRLPGRLDWLLKKRAVSLSNMRSLEWEVTKMKSLSSYMSRLPGPSERNMDILMMLLNLLLGPWFYITFTTSTIWFFISSEPDSVFSSLTTPVAASTLAVLTSTIARRLTPQPIKLRADIELTCYTPAGIDAIKKALRSGEKQSNEAVPIKAKLVAPPLYVLSTNSTDKVYFLKKYCISTLLTISNSMLPLKD